MVESWLPVSLPLLLLAGFLINGVFGRKIGKGGVSFVACALPIIAFILVAAQFVQLLARGDWPGLVSDLGTWLQYGDEADGLRVAMAFQIDRLTLLMTLIVTGVGSLIHIYATGYMAEVSDQRFARFFAYLNLFTAMMLVLVTGANLPLLFVGWEGVGLCSYLLIGFEYEEDWKASAGMKAFIANRVGDFAFILGMLMVVGLSQDVFGGAATLSFGQVNQLGLQATSLTADQQWTLGLAALCFFVGATGKSAQIPLFVWLPDAMAGPTPVSALIHAATMVTAGIYLLVRNGLFFEAAALSGMPILTLVALIGALTAFLAASAAMAQNDIKKVLAYSTVSQLGYMFMGAGAMAYSAAVFHLMTHAFFKALLFLAAGAVIHALHGEQDMRRMGGLRKVLPTCFWAFLIGGVALAGIPPFAGFFSKDMILFKVWEQAQAHHRGLLSTWGIIFLLGVGGACMTAFYTMRLMLLTFFGERRTDPEVLAHVHRPNQAMSFALWVLLGLSVVGGFVGLPPLLSKSGDRIGAYLERYAPQKHSPQETWIRIEASQPRAEGEAPQTREHLEEEWHHVHHTAEIVSLVLSLLVVALGLFFGWTRYVKGPREEAAPGSFEAVGEEFLREAWGLDQFYRTCIVEPLVSISSWLWKYIDVGVLDRGLVDGSGSLSVWVSELVTAFQTGRLTRAVGYLVFGAIALLALALVYAA